MVDSATQEAFGQFSPLGLTDRLIRLAGALPSSWVGMRGSFLARKLATRLLGGRPLDATRFGARMRLQPYANTCEKRIAFTPHLFDPIEREVLAREARSKPGFVFLDIGANIGGYALSVAASADATAKILAVEPQADLFERLSYNAALNAFGNLKLVNCALSDQNGFVDLFLNLAQHGEASIRRVADPNLPVLRVPCQTLQTLVESEGLTHVDAIKIDVEGAEDLILKPFFAHAPRAIWPSLIVMEIARNAESEALRVELAELGYETERDLRNNVILRLAA